MIFKQFDGFEVTPTDTVEQTMADAKAKINEIQASESGDIGWYINVIHPARKFFGIVTSDVMASEYPNLAQEIEIFNGDELATNISEINARIDEFSTKTSFSERINKTLGESGDYTTFADAFNDYVNNYRKNATTGDIPEFVIMIGNDYSPIQETFYGLDLSGIIIVGSITYSESFEPSTNAGLFFDDCIVPRFVNTTFKVENGVNKNMYGLRVQGGRLHVKNDISVSDELLGMFISHCNIVGYGALKANSITLNGCMANVDIEAETLDCESTNILGDLLYSNIIASNSVVNNYGTLVSPTETITKSIVNYL
jgi:hypothetical protein